VKEKKYAKGLISLLVVIIGVSGIGWLTWHLGGMLVNLVAGGPLPSESKTETGVGEGTILHLPELRFWICQAGVYKDKEKAQFAVETLKARGWKAAIIKEEPYTIGIGLFAGKDQALAFNAILAADHIETWVREEVFPALDYRVNGRDAQGVSRILSLSNSLLRGSGLNKIQAELEGDRRLLFAEGCPADFARLEQMFLETVTGIYPENDGKQVYNQDLLMLFSEYKFVTTKFFT